jgi:capsular polysaccharide biosynthesis protein
MNSAPTIEPRLKLTPIQRLVRRVPCARKVFWVPEGCVRHIAELAEAPAPEKVLVKNVAPSEPKYSFGDSSPGELYVAQLSPGKVVGDCLLVASAADKVLGSMQGLHGEKNPENHWVLRRCRYRREACLPGTSALLAAASGANYYHWLFESLPRLWLLEQAGVDLNSIDHFLLNEEQSPFHGQTLERLGVAPGKLMPARKDRVLRCEHLVVPSLPADPMVYPGWSLAFLRERLLPVSGPVNMERIFISRRHAVRRKLLNESEIEDRLRSAGFKTIALEQHSFAEQIGLFVSAKVIVAPHGAGLSNLVFSLPGTKVVELVAPTFINHCYQKLASAMRLPYVEVIGTLSGKPGKRAEEDDFMIAADKVMEALERLGV